MDENIKAVRREKWRQVIMLQKASGLTITEWCEQNGIRARQFHYWQKILRDNALLEMNTEQGTSEPLLPACASSHKTAIQTFAEVPITSQPLQEDNQDKSFSGITGHDSGIMIRCQDLQIRLSDTFNEGALARVLQVIRNA